MIAPGRVAAVLLAAGRSTRFGAEDKLAARLDGVPLADHAMRALEAIPFAARVMVVGPDAPKRASPGFALVVNAWPTEGQARSIQLGVSHALAPVRPAAILIALADMPFVTTPHLNALLERHGPEADAITASAITRGRAGPPALFGAAWFDALEALDGDHGARALLASAALVSADPAMLTDIDTPEELRAAAGPRRG